MRPLNSYAPLFFAVPFLAVTACGGTSDEAQVEVAEAAFALSNSNDCIDAFATRPFLIRLTENRGWGQEEIEAICAEIEDVATTYANNSTLTVLTVAGVGNLDGDTLETAYFIGAAGYDLTEVRAWLDKVRASRATRICSQEAADIVRDGGTLPEGFMRDCLTEETGEPYPEPIFQEIRSNNGIDGLDDAAAGLAVSLVIYNVPGTGTVAAFVSGGFYAQVEPPYAAFAGCGAVLGLDDVAEDAGFAYVCVGAEY